MFCHVPTSQVLAVHDVSSLYHVPLLLKAQGLVGYLQGRLKLNDIITSQSRIDVGLELMIRWKALTVACVFLSLLHNLPQLLTNLCPSSSHDRLFDQVNIVLVGKYTTLQDSYTSVVKSLEHAALQCARKLNITVSWSCCGR